MIPSVDLVHDVFNFSLEEDNVSMVNWSVKQKRVCVCIIYYMSC